MSDEQSSSSKWSYPAIAGGEAVDAVAKSPESVNPKDVEEQNLANLIAENQILNEELKNKIGILNSCIDSLGDNIKVVTKDYVGNISKLIANAVKKIINIEVEDKSDDIKALFQSYITQFDGAETVSIQVSPKLKVILDETDLGAKHEIIANENLCDSDILIELSDRIVSIDTNDTVNNWILSHG